MLLIELYITKAFVHVSTMKIFSLEDVSVKGQVYFVGDLDVSRGLTLIEQSNHKHKYPTL